MPRVHRVPDGPRVDQADATSIASTDIVDAEHEETVDDPRRDPVRRRGRSGDAVRGVTKSVIRRLARRGEQPRTRVYGVLTLIFRSIRQVCDKWRQTPFCTHLRGDTRRTQSFPGAYARACTHIVETASPSPPTSKLTGLSGRSDSRRVHLHRSRTA